MDLSDGEEDGILWIRSIRLINFEKQPMNRAEITLAVPYDKAFRMSIRKKVNEFFHEKEIMPPVSYEALAEYASELSLVHQWHEQYRAFVMVCSGNAIWRTVVGSVPFNRRIFLLPQCLKHSSNCQAIEDELGLLCRECGNCSISGLLREAENLGYVALVTEGTTITTRLIESGKVDAVIGVGCMDVLQKMFESVSKYSIPSIGIPLITCGCKDTISDAEWIKEELYFQIESTTTRLLNLNHLRNKTSAIFGEEQLNRMLGQAKTQSEKIVQASLLSGGQRLRPLLTVLAYEAFSNQPETLVMNQLALSVECFHKASLIHDDIEDNDETRYGKETIHAQYGIPVAINTGDFLIGEGYRLIAETDLPPNVIIRCLKIISTGHSTLAIGQGTELLNGIHLHIPNLEEIINIFKNKTAAAFKVSLLLGAAAAEADEASLKKLECFSNNIGIAYQIKDDLQDYKDHQGNIDLKKPSILLSLLIEMITEEEEASLKEAFINNHQETITTLFSNYLVHQETEELLKVYIDKSKKSLEDFQNIGLKLALHEILGKIFKDYL
jgi:geranylgeranyl pyrophosphate synthase